EQRDALRSAMRERLAAEVGEGLADRVAEKVGDMRERSESAWAYSPAGSVERPIQLTPEQRAGVSSIIRQTLADGMRARLPDAIAVRLAILTREQREAVRTGMKEKLEAEVREGFSDRFANRLSGSSGD